MAAQLPYYYDFARGYPNTDELPAEELQQILQNMNKDNTIDLLRQALQYGQEQGNPEFIHELELFLERQCALDDIGAEGAASSSSSRKNEFFITEGVSHAIDLLTMVASSPGDVVLTEQPTYYLVADIFHNHGLTVEALPMRSSSSDARIRRTVNVEALQEQLQQRKQQQQQQPRLVYIIPSHQNPTGRTMSVKDRQKLAQLADQYQFLVIADEVYHLLDWHHGDGDERPARMVLWNNNHHNHDITRTSTSSSSSTSKKKLLSGCVSVSSFSKIFGPGIRCGWIEAASDIVQSIVNNVGYIQSQGGVMPVMGAILQTALADHTIDRVLTQFVQNYQRRCNMLCDILETKEPRIRLLCRPTGGFFVWIEFPSVDDSMGPVADFLTYCRAKANINFLLGSRCDACPPPPPPNNDDDNDDASSNSSSLKSCARLCFAYLSDDELERGANLLVKMFQDYTQQRDAIRCE